MAVGGSLTTTRRRVPDRPLPVFAHESRLDFSARLILEDNAASDNYQADEGCLNIPDYGCPGMVDFAPSPTIDPAAGPFDIRRKGLMTGKSAGETWAWIRLSEGLVGGIHHALNNRIAALGGAAQVLQGDADGNQALIQLLSGEVQRMESTAALLRLFGPEDGGAAPVLLTDIFDQAGTLFELHHELRDLRLDIEMGNGVLPVWSSPTGLLRTLMMIIAAAGAGITRGSSLAGREAAVVAVKVVGDASTVRIVVRVTPRKDDSELPVVMPEDIGSMACTIGATFEVSNGGGEWELQLSTLAEARRREREDPAS